MIMKLKNQRPGPKGAVEPVGKRNVDVFTKKKILEEQPCMSPSYGIHFHLGILTADLDSVEWAVN
jgi:hypothetical protein